MYKEIVRESDPVQVRSASNTATANRTRIDLSVRVGGIDKTVRSTSQFTRNTNGQTIVNMISHEFMQMEIRVASLNGPPKNNLFEIEAPGNKKK